QAGAATTAAELGNPLAGTGYQLCLYDESGGTPTLFVGASAPPDGTCAGRPCWRVSTGRVAYGDRGLSPDGIAKLDVRAGSDGAARIALKGRGINLGLPPLPLAEDPRVVLQLLNASG